MKPKDAAERLQEISEEIYELLEDAKEVLSKADPLTYERASWTWLPHIDGALENRGEWIGVSMTSLKTTVEALYKLETEKPYEEIER